MAKNYNALADDIVKGLGGVDNITKIFHCATRVRTQLLSMDQADLDALKRNPDILGVVESAGGVQVVVGNDVAKVYDIIINKFNIKENNAGSEKLNAPAGDKTEKQGVLSMFLNVLSAIIGPAIPLIMCSGLISAILVIMTKLGLSTESTTYTIIKMFGNAALYFLPVFLAYTSAKKFGCDIMMSVFFGVIFISPTLIGFTSLGSSVHLFGLPVKAVDYSSTVIPVIFTIWVFKYVERFVGKIVPAAIKFVFKPLLCVIIMMPVMLCITGPVGSYLGDALLAVMGAVNSAAPWATVLVIGSLAPLLVLTGMHLALIPLVMTMFSTVGYDNMLFTAFIGMNFSQFGVALACLFKTKNKNLRTLASSCAITSFLAGVTEPTLYGICVRMKKPLIATWIACVANAVFCAIFSVKVFNFGAPSFFTMPIFMNPDGSMNNFYFAVAAVVITIAVSFAATWILGFDDSVYGEETAAS